MAAAIREKKYAERILQHNSISLGKKKFKIFSFNYNIQLSVNLTQKINYLLNKKEKMKGFIAANSQYFK